jgi:hypothetical protein
MSFVADLSFPLLAVERPAKGRMLITWPRRGVRLPLDISVTTQEVHLALAGCDGPALVIDIDHIINPAIREFEMLMGVKRSRR